MLNNNDNDNNDDNENHHHHHNSHHPNFQSGSWGKWLSSFPPPSFPQPFV